MKKRKRLKELNRMIESAEAEKARIQALPIPIGPPYLSDYRLGLLDGNIYILKKERSKLVTKIRKLKEKDE